MQEALFTTQVKGGGKAYFFDVKQAKAGKQSKYVQITESRLQDGQPRRSSLTIFPEQVEAFKQALSEASANVG